MKAACPDPNVVALISLGTPLHISADQAARAGSPAEARSYAFRHLFDCPKPKLFVSGSEDPYAGRAALEQLVADLPQPAELVFVEGAGHFFEDHLDQMRQVIGGWVTERLLAGAP
jgi:alpha/beta superfamily hydrolase